MSIPLDPREILAHLNGLGYTNINAHQLKAFMTDLKRLILFEEYQRNQQRSKNFVAANKRHTNSQSDESDDRHQEYEDSVGADADDEGNNEGQEDIFHVLHRSETAASRARKKSQSKANLPKVDSNTHVITLHTCKPCKVHPNGVQNILGNIVPPIKCHDSERTTQTSSLATGEEQKVLTGSSCAVTTKSKSCSSLPGTSIEFGEKKSSRPKSAKSTKSSYIKPKVVKKPLKSDPVALYHQYKQEWDKIKFPGQHHHDETRWAIREKLLGA